MNKKLPFIFFSLVLSQTVVLNSSIMIYQLNYFTWDYNGDKLFFHSEGKEYRCVEKKYIEYHNIEYKPSTYILTSDYYLINDIVSPRTCRYSYDEELNCHIFIHQKYIKEFTSISVTKDYFYIRRPEDPSIGGLLCVDVTCVWITLGLYFLQWKSAGSRG
jgi:hypothetical protein